MSGDNAEAIASAVKKVNREDKKKLFAENLKVIILELESIKY